MRLLNKFLSQYRDKIARIADFSLLEASIPFPLPFLKIGLSNSILLIDLRSREKNAKENITDFLSLAFAKCVVSNVYSGLLFTPFFISSLAATLLSALVMYAAFFALFPKISLYGVSVLGSAVFSAVQTVILSKIISQSVLYFLPITLFFSVFSAFITAFLAYRADFSSSAPKSTTAAKRKVKILPYISLFVFVSLQCVFSPSGKVIFALGSLVITDDAFVLSVKRATYLLVLSILSKLALFCLLSKDKMQNKA